MKSYNYLQVLFPTIVCSLSFKSYDTDNLPENLKLKMVNIVFRHGDRTPDNSNDESYPNDPFKDETYFPVGHGALTDKGKLRAFQLGDFLRKKYEKLLGGIYNPEDISIRSTHFDRTKMSLMFVLNGLYPSESDPSLDWQNLPIKYKNADNDFLLMPTGCPKFKKIVAEIEQLPDVKEQIAKFKSLWGELSKLTGNKITSARNVFNLYNLLVAQKSFELKIPNWAEKMLHNEAFLNSVKLDIHIRNYNETVKKLNAGRLLRKMTNDMIAKINGDLKNGKKIKLYSAHDINVAAHLLSLGLKEPLQPYYSSAVILELYRDENENYYVQVVYYNGSDEENLKTLNCSSNIYEMCEFNEYLELIKNVIPSDDELECCENGLEKCFLTW